MLRRLSGRAHKVHTGVAVRAGAEVAVEVVTTIVTFVALQPAVIEWYVGTGEPLDKAGAYAIQGHGGVFVEHVRGSTSNVVGLPLTTVARLLERALDSDGRTHCVAGSATRSSMRYAQQGRACRASTGSLSACLRVGSGATPGVDLALSGRGC